MTPPTGSDACVQDLNDRDVEDVNRAQRPPVGHEVAEEEVDADDIYGNVQFPAGLIYDDNVMEKDEDTDEDDLYGKQIAPSIYLTPSQ